jgi:hypothetical protein
VFHWEEFKESKEGSNLHVSTASCLDVVAYALQGLTNGKSATTIEAIQSGRSGALFATPESKTLHFGRSEGLLSAPASAGPTQALHMGGLELLLQLENLMRLCSLEEEEIYVQHQQKQHRHLMRLSTC